MKRVLLALLFSTVTVQANTTIDSPLVAIYNCSTAKFYIDNGDGLVLQSLPSTAVLPVRMVVRELSVTLESANKKYSGDMEFLKDYLIYGNDIATLDYSTVNDKTIFTVNIGYKNKPSQIEYTCTKG